MQQRWVVDDFGDVGSGKTQGCHCGAEFIVHQGGRNGKRERSAKKPDELRFIWDDQIG
jgi:hypothetical protein